MLDGTKACSNSNLPSTAIMVKCSGSESILEDVSVMEGEIVVSCSMSLPPNPAGKLHAEEAVSYLANGDSGYEGLYTFLQQCR